MCEYVLEEWTRNRWEIDVCGGGDGEAVGRMSGRGRDRKRGEEGRAKGAVR